MPDPRPAGAVPAALAPPIRQVGCELVLDVGTGGVTLLQVAPARHHAERRDVPAGPDRPTAIASWVCERIAYELGASGPVDSAVDTLLGGRGGCRDAADSSFVTTLDGDAELLASTVLAHVDGDLPADDHRARMRLA